MRRMIERLWWLWLTIFTASTLGIAVLSARADGLDWMQTPGVHTRHFDVPSDVFPLNCRPGCYFHSFEFEASFRVPTCLRYRDVKLYDANWNDLPLETVEREKEDSYFFQAATPDGYVVSGRVWLTIRVENICPPIG